MFLEINPKTGRNSKPRVTQQATMLSRAKQPRLRRAPPEDRDLQAWGTPMVVLSSPYVTGVTFAVFYSVPVGTDSAL